MSGRESNYASRLAKAEHDLLNIQNNLSAEQIPWDTVCFHAQQAAEKCLKAFLIYHGRPFSRTHDLVALLASCVEIEPTLGRLQDDCRRLNYYGVAARYPDDLYEPGERDGREMFAAAQRVKARVGACLPQ